MSGRRRSRPQGAGHRALLATVLVVACLAACGTSQAGPSPAGTPASSAVPAIPPPAPVAWVACPDDPSLQCGSVEVPVDYRRPSGDHLELALRRAPSLVTPARGTLVVNPGGPGESGNQILPVFLALLPSTVRRDFDVVSFDPRGTGSSSPLRCGTPLSALTSADPVPARPGQPLPGTAEFTAMARACQRQPLTPFLDTTNTARDLDRIRQALGLPTIDYYGLSYGTVLGTEYAALFPRRVGAMVLDGAVDVNASLTTQALEAAPAEEASLHHLLGLSCPSRDDCPLGPHPTAGYAAVVAELRRRPLPAPGGTDPYPVTLGDLDTAALFALSVPSASGTFLDALSAATHGDGAPLRSIALQFQEDVDGSPLEEALWAITCNDAAEHPGGEAAGRLATALAGQEPLLGAYAVTYTMGGCVSWPTARQPVAGVHPRGTPPVLVIGNTGDPNTPYVGARHLTAAFSSARLLTWRGWGHTWLLSGSGDACMQRWLVGYLTGSGLPPAGTTCS